MNCFFIIIIIKNKIINKLDKFMFDFIIIIIEKIYKL